MRTPTRDWAAAAVCGRTLASVRVEDLERWLAACAVVGADGGAVVRHWRPGGPSPLAVEAQHDGVAVRLLLTGRPGAGEHVLAACGDLGGSYWGAATVAAVRTALAAARDRLGPAGRRLYLHTGSPDTLRWGTPDRTVALELAGVEIGHAVVQRWVPGAVVRPSDGLELTAPAPQEVRR